MNLSPECYQIGGNKAQKYLFTAHSRLLDEKLLFALRMTLSTRLPKASRRYKFSQNQPDVTNLKRMPQLLKRLCN